MDTLLDVLLPPACPGCGREGAVLCAPCRAHLAARLDAPAGLPLGLPTDLPVGLIQLEWCAPFSGPTRATLHELKYAANRRLVGPLGDLLAARWGRAGWGGDVLVPVPVHAARLRQRGYDQAVLLASAVGARLGLPVVEGLRRGRATAAQYALGRQARGANVGTAFEVIDGARGRIAGRWVVLVDDVVTTGSTMAACATALVAAGAEAVSGLAVARER
ncbi:MAG: ComF family protein [Candidatus Limnocylindrales bacterium]